MLGELLGQYELLGGFAAIVAALVNAGKRVGWIKDGQAGNVATILNLVGFAAYALLVQFKFEVVPDVDVALAAVASIIVALVGLLGQFIISGLSNKLLNRSGVPIFGHRN